MPPRHIRLRGVRVHNLQDLDVDLPHHALVVVCGVSGSGKTSLALDTLYAEGQRRYIESFSAYTRQFLQRLDKPDCDSIEGIPPAIAVSRGGASRSNRSTVATATETADYLRLLFAKAAQLRCPRCGRPIQSESPQSAAAALGRMPAGARLMIGFHVTLPSRAEASEILFGLQQQGYVRVVVGGTTQHLAKEDRAALAERIGEGETPALVIVDRLRAGEEVGRMTESLEAAFGEGSGQALVLIDGEGVPEAMSLMEEMNVPEEMSVDGRRWGVLRFERTRRCAPCDLEFPDPQPRLFSFNNPVGACPTCEGFGDVVDLDMDLVVPDPSKSIREGAIAPWSTPAYRHAWQELLRVAPEYDVPTEVPFSRLTAEQVARIRHGDPQRGFGGLDGFFTWLDRKKYKMHVRVFLSRWRSYRRCPDCGGRRLRPEALAYRVAGMNLAEIMAQEVDQAAEFFGQIQLEDRQQQVARDLLEPIRNRLSYLQSVGLGYLQLDRTLRTLSGGEAQRVALTAALGSTLVNMLYVLDEPTAGLHPHDVGPLAEAIVGLRQRGNTVVVVEHDEQIIRRADWLIEIGPGAGSGGGQLVAQGTPSEVLENPSSLTGDYLCGRRELLAWSRQRRPPRGFLHLLGARGNNLRGIDVQFPLGCLALVTGVSGSGKSTLVQDTLYGAISRRKHRPSGASAKSASARGNGPLAYDDLIGDGQIDEVMLVDQSPISRSPRSNPVTYIKAFDPIRRVFAETLEARTRGLTAGHFSFNGPGGRCEACQGDGVLQIDMQFLADVYMKCPDCKGTRYRPEILQVHYRDRTIAEVLEMSVRQAHGFFRGHAKVQSRLKRLIDVGLDYLGLGQSATTLSSGEAQRLKLAGFLASASRRRTLFLLDEPTTGLHFSDVVKLIDCFDALLADGHSLLVVEHNRQLMCAADYLIDLGPGAASEGGRVVAAGTPEQVAAHPESLTGRVLAAAGVGSPA